MQKAELGSKEYVTDILRKLAIQYPSEIQSYSKVARHIEGTDQCMITLPCKNKDKVLLIFAIEI